ncbi:MAG TPA: ATP-dependent Clp protease ATP-binding subunit ClpX [Dehalococcoidia bacterium]|nr:ATP-dependent Clp protease ATP-binding subunit ClpX [Dehalococcoidia bacterium]
MTSTRNGPKLGQCSFCEKAQGRSTLVVAGQGRAAVCYDCIKVLGQLVDEDAPQREEPAEPQGPLVPREIYAHLETYVVSQEKAKKILSVAVYNHYKRIWSGSKRSDVELQKTNILLIGPTGCGKTLLAETLARTLDVPFAVCDATSLTESGYVGEDVENILLRLIQSADWDIPKAEKGIIYIDEIDKIARKEGINRSITRDVSGEGVQQELLKIIEGCVANVPPQGGRKHPHQEFLQIDTKNVLFICGGAFDGLDEVVAKRVESGSTKMGFLAGGRTKVEVEGSYLSNTTPEDLLEYGFIPEMVGRLPVAVALEPLDKEALIRVLTEPKNAIVKQYQELFSMDGVELEFTGDALAAAADRALEQQTGARCLRYVIEDTLMDVMYDLPSVPEVVKCVVDGPAILGERNPTLITDKGKTIYLPMGPIQKSA